MSKRKPRGYWTLERCMEDAAQYGARLEWSKSNRRAYAAAQRNGWLDQCCANMSGGQFLWAPESCAEDAAKYSSRREWSLKGSGAYNAAIRLGCLDACCAHMDSPHKPRGYWTLERCMADAARYSSRIDWQSASRPAYSAAKRKGWIDQCCKHMEALHVGTANDVVYIWRDADSDLHKVGVTSDRIGERRIGVCSSHNDMDPRIVFMLKVADARAVESKLLELGTDPELDSSIDGYTEFRRLTDAELGQAVSIAYEAALAA